MADPPLRRVVVTGGTTEGPPEKQGGSGAGEFGSEIATLIVGDKRFEDWESVWVQHRWREGWPLFRFTASERDNLPTDWTKLQFKPGDRCTILLGGRLGITGLILQRQVAYDANNHAVQLSGVGETWLAATSSIAIKDSNFDNMTLQQAADKALQPFKTSAIPIGTLDSRVFPKLSSQPGELVFDFIDRISRMRGVALGSDEKGNLLLIGQHSKPVVQNLYEGQNILKMQCIISDEKLSKVYSHTGQRSVEDQESMRKTNEVQAQVKGSLKGDNFKHIETVAEQPITQADAEARANYEAIDHESSVITAHVTVQGWLRGGEGGGDLWRTGDNVWVYSPMAMMNLVMKIQTATFAQDNKAGTTTTLELVLPWRLGDKPYGRGPPTDYPQAEDPMTADQPPQPPPPAVNTTEKPPTAHSPGAPSPPISQ